MTKIAIVLVLTFGLISAISCAYQHSIIIEEPTAPRVVIKKVPVGQPAQEAEKEAEKKEEYYESDFRPDFTRGYIENRAFPYLPEVWLLVEGGQKILLIGQDNGQSPPKIANGEIREFNLPPETDAHILHIYWWEYLPYYGGWRKLKKVEVVKVEIAEFPDSDWIKHHYGWKVVIYQLRSVVRTGYTN